MSLALSWQPHAETGHDDFTPTAVLAGLGLDLPPDTPIIEAIRNGFPVALFDRLARELGIGRQQLQKILALPAATLARRRKAGRLSPQESDRLFRVVTTWSTVLQLFDGDRAEATRWLTTPARGLGGSTPLDFLDTEAGARQVQDLVGRLEHGVLP